MQNKIGIALSGGGVRGMAHIGLLAALEEEGIKASIVSGASAGAIIGALYAQGYSPEKMLEFFKTTPIFHWKFYSPQKPGLLDTEKYRMLFTRFFPDNNFSTLKKKLFVAATDIGLAENVFFHEGELVRTLLASAAVPVLFSPVEINGRLFSDGGIMNNFPIEPLIDTCDFIIGSFCNPVTKLSKQEIKSSLQVFKRATELRLYADTKAKYVNCHYVFEPEGINKYHLLDSRYIDEVFELGYQAAQQELGTIKRILAGEEAARIYLPETKGTQIKRG